MEHVVAAAEEGDVVALLTVDEVVVGAAKQQVGAVAAEDRVVARAAVDGDLDQRREVAGGAEEVIAAVHVEDEVLGGADVDREGRRVEPVEADARAVGRRSEHLCAAAAVDFGGVVAASAFVKVGVVAGVPDHPVVAGLAEHLVVGVAAGERVVARAAEQQVEAALAQENVVVGLAEQLIAARAAREHVVARAAEQPRGRECAHRLVERQLVVAAEPADLDEAGVGDRRRAAQDQDRSVIAEDPARSIALHPDDVGAVAAGEVEKAARREEIADAHLRRSVIGSRDAGQGSRRFSLHRRPSTQH